MIFTTTRELLLDYAFTPVLCDERPPGYAMNLINMSVPRLLSAGRKDVVWRGAYDESMVNSGSHSEGSVLFEQ